jgi:Nif-specific regulatory protein
LNTKWITWNELPWVARGDAGMAVQLCDRLMQAALNADSVNTFLHSALPELATEFPAQWVSIWKRTPQWELIAEHGRHTWSQLPTRFFDEVLEHEASGCLSAAADLDDWSVIGLPLPSSSEGQPRILVLSGRRLASDELSIITGVGRVLGYGLSLNERMSQQVRRADKLRNTLAIAATFAGAPDTSTLLESIAQAATKLLDCDRASIFIWDRERHEVVACPALGIPGGSLRIPDNVGIVGQVIHTGDSIRVDDAYADSRFGKSVDKATGYRTRTLLAVPLLDADGKRIGCFEGINKNNGRFDADDEESLTQLGIQAAVALASTRERENLLRSHQQMTEQAASQAQIVGVSGAIEQLRGTVQRLALTDLPVLILGESGTGKEVFAQALHYHGSRSKQPFIAVNCAALTETLLESELFGHEKGAFTDAHTARQGKFELADGGTIFLDEIGDMSLGGQAKLLRVLEQKIITRVGGSQTIPINVRVIAATNAKLAQLVREKRFREDLFYRLSVVTMDLPPLRDRSDDVIPLAEFFLEKFSQQAKRPALSLASEAKKRLQAHGWPGNVRELRNLMERVAFLAPGPTVQAGDIAFILTPEKDTFLDTASDIGLADATNKFQQEYIRRAVKRVKGNMSEAARLLGLHRTNLYRKMSQLGMQEGRLEILTEK